MFVNKFVKNSTRLTSTAAAAAIGKIQKFLITRKKKDRKNKNTERTIFQCCKSKNVVAAGFQGKVKASADAKAKRKYININQKCNHNIVRIVKTVEMAYKCITRQPISINYISDLFKGSLEKSLNELTERRAPVAGTARLANTLNRTF